MTTFHDQQPQSRRAVRQSERDEAADTESAGTQSAQTEGGFTDSAPTSPQQFAAPAGDMWDTVSRRAAQLPPVSPPGESTPGRRAATPPAATAEPLIYSTQSRPVPPSYNAPSYDTPSFRSRGASAPQPVPFDTATSAPADGGAPADTVGSADQPAYRVRDFSPEPRDGVQEGSHRHEPASVAPAGAVTDLDYQTDARFLSAAAAAPLAPVSQVPASVAPINKMWVAPAPDPSPVVSVPVVSVPVVSVPVVSVPVVSVPLDPALEHTLTRRQLRAMQQAESAEPGTAPQGLAPAIAPTQASATAEQAWVLPQQPDPPTEQQGVFPLVEPAAEAPSATPFSFLSALPIESPAVVAHAAVAPAAVYSAVVPSAVATPAPAAPVSATPFDSLFSLPEGRVQPAEPVAQVPADIVPAPVADQPTPWTPPTGHWSTQLGASDEEIESTISRSVGSGSTTTSALVLPSIPQGADIRGPLTATGEIMLTGSIELPHTLAATGQSDRFDHGGIDELFDLSDAEVISTDSAPVRAIRAVSTHTSGRGVTHTQKPKGTRAITALLIAASSMAVVVAGLLIAAFAFNVF